MQQKIIQQIVSCTKMTVSDVETFLSLGREMTIPIKTLLSKPKTKVELAYYLKSGIIRHYIIGKKKGEFTKNFMQGPRFMIPSLTDFFLQTSTNVYCEALTDLEVICWDYSTLMNFSDNHPRMYRYLLTSVVHAFHHKELKEIALNQYDAKERYAQFQLDFPDFIAVVPLQYIASYLNIRPETLSRIRSERIS